MKHNRKEYEIGVFFSVCTGKIYKCISFDNDILTLSEVHLKITNRHKPYFYVNFPTTDQRVQISYTQARRGDWMCYLMPFSIFHDTYYGMQL